MSDDKQFDKWDTAPTPRTDAEVINATFPDAYLVAAGFCRMLERELAESVEDSKAILLENAKLTEALSAIGELEEKPVAWLIERPKGTGKQQTIEYELVLSPLTDDTFMDEGDEAWPLYKKSDIKHLP
jgi:hypothetical protein